LFLDHRWLHRHLGTVGLDHHEARVGEKLLRIDTRLFHARLLDSRRRRWRRRLGCPDFGRGFRVAQLLDAR
jgi:hypothetical protein